MKRHLAYLIYLLRHKWFVAVAGRKLKLSWWRILTHDLSKFRPSEWFPYARTFYDSTGRKQYNESSEFDVAWLKHQHRNSHHWQYWLLRQDDGGFKNIEMRYMDIIEMVSDWMGAGRAITGRWEVQQWYEKNNTKMSLHQNTKMKVEKILNDVKIVANAKR